MVVAVVPVRVMQVTLDQIVEMIPVGNRFMATAGPVNVACLVPRAGMIRRTHIRVFVADLQAMLVDMITVRKMEIPIMQVVDVALVLDPRVATTGAVSMTVSFMNVAIRHFGLPLFCGLTLRFASDI